MRFERSVSQGKKPAFLRWHRCATKPQKSAVAGVFQSSIAQLKPIIEKIMAIPGVEAILKPAIDALMSKLDAFKA